MKGSGLWGRVYKICKGVIKAKRPLWLTVCMAWQMGHCGCKTCVSCLCMMAI